MLEKAPFSRRAEHAQQKDVLLLWRWARGAGLAEAQRRRRQPAFLLPTESILLCAMRNLLLAALWRKDRAKGVSRNLGLGNRVPLSCRWSLGKAQNKKGDAPNPLKESLVHPPQRECTACENPLANLKIFNSLRLGWE